MCKAIARFPQRLRPDRRARLRLRLDLLHGPYGEFAATRCPASGPSGIRARLLGWFHLSRSADKVQARAVARQTKCRNDVVRATEHFHTKHGRVTWRLVHQDLGVELQC